MEKTAKEFYKSRDRHHTPEYDKVTWQIKKAQKTAENCNRSEKNSFVTENRSTKSSHA